MLLPGRANVGPRRKLKAIMLTGLGVVDAELIHFSRGDLPG